MKKTLSFFLITLTCAGSLHAMERGNRFNPTGQERFVSSNKSLERISQDKRNLSMQKKQLDMLKKKFETLNPKNRQPFEGALETQETKHKEARERCKKLEYGYAFGQLSTLETHFNKLEELTKNYPGAQKKEEIVTYKTPVDYLKNIEESLKKSQEALGSSSVPEQEKKTLVGTVFNISNAYLDVIDETTQSLEAQLCAAVLKFLKASQELARLTKTTTALDEVQKAIFFALNQCAGFMKKNTGVSNQERDKEVKELHFESLYNPYEMPIGAEYSTTFIFKENSNPTVREKIIVNNLDYFRFEKIIGYVICKVLQEYFAVLRNDLEGTGEKPEKSFSVQSEHLDPIEQSIKFIEKETQKIETNKKEIQKTEEEKNKKTEIQKTEAPKIIQEQKPKQIPLEAPTPEKKENWQDAVERAFRRCNTQLCQKLEEELKEEDVNEIFLKHFKGETFSFTPQLLDFYYGYKAKNPESNLCKVVESFGRLQFDEVMKSSVEIMNQMPNLYSLYLRGAIIDIGSIPTLKNLQWLYLGGNSLSQNPQEILNALQEQPRLTYLTIKLESSALFPEKLEKDTKKLPMLSEVKITAIDPKIEQMEISLD